MIFLAIYAFINVIALAVLFMCAYEYDSCGGDVFFIYPQIFEILDDYEVNLAGKISMSTMLTLMFLPAFLAWYALVSVAFFAIIVWSCIFKLFCKIFKKRNR